MDAISKKRMRFYEFFAGGGMVRAALGRSWECLFANDFDHKKAETYRKNWGGGEFSLGDVRDIRATDLITIEGENDVLIINQGRIGLDVHLRWKAQAVCRTTAAEARGPIANELVG